MYPYRGCLSIQISIVKEKIVSNISRLYILNCILSAVYLERKCPLVRFGHNL